MQMQHLPIIMQILVTAATVILMLITINAPAVFSLGINWLFYD